MTCFQGGAGKVKSSGFTNNYTVIFYAVVFAWLMLTCVTHATRYMENLNRGVVVVRTGSGAFASWRLLGLDPSGIGFNLYRSTAGGTAVKLNGSVLTGETCYTDTTGNFTQNNTYYIKPVIGGIEQAASGSFTLTANHVTEPCVVVPLSSGSTDIIHFVWVGDLDGDGEYDFVVDRINWEGRPQAVEAYNRNGTLLWSMDLGPNSTNTYNIEPGSSTIDVGHWDGVTVYDLDCDGKAEVMIRTANGVTFGDGTTLVDSNDNHQFISVLDGMTGAERARMQIPTDYIADGPLAAQLGIGYLNGATPNLVAVMKNRIGSGDFNMMVCAWDFKGSSLVQKWKWLRGSQNCPDGHQMRIVDVDDDGQDEVCEIGFVLDSDGTLLYSLGDSGVVHGDRWHIGKFDQNRAGLQGYGIQQDNASGLREYYYDAGTGEILWTYVGAVGDMGRGDAGDIDPRYPGYECWSFDGVWNGPSGTQISPTGTEPWPSLRLWWDGDDLSESYNDGKIEQYDPYSTSTGRRVSRLVSTWHYQTATGSDRGAPMFYGDIFGDWREEVVMTSFDYTKLVIFTTNIPTSRRIYTLPHNPEYRNCMTVKGYMQSHQVDYYLGDGMSTPPVPDIKLVGDSTGTVNCEWWTGISGTVVSDLTSNINYPNNPDGQEYLMRLEGPVNWTSAYGTRVRGYIIPSQTGDYIFWIASDDSSELWLSSDAVTANASLIASVTGYTSQYQWDKFTSQQSISQSLTAGHKYYIEILHKDGTGGDHWEVAWQRNGTNDPQVIEGVYLSPLMFRKLGDLNDDSKVNLEDVGMFSGYWHNNDCDLDLSIDMNGDCLADIVDLTLLAQNWLAGS